MSIFQYPPIVHPYVHGMTSSLILDDLNKGLYLSEFMPNDRAVLLFIQRGGRKCNGDLLLIEKKRGLGAGKINGPGGKLEDNEDFFQATIRETKEEVGLTPHNLELRGRLYFSFSDGYKLYGEVFWAYDFSGEMRETEEAKPFWCSVQEIPYDRMWTDDRLWLPQAIIEQPFSAYFLFDGDKLLQAQTQYAFNSDPAIPGSCAGSSKFSKNH